jgi:hypothetical protein
VGGQLPGLALTDVAGKKQLANGPDDHRLAAPGFNPKVLLLSRPPTIPVRKLPLCQASGQLLYGLLLISLAKATNL